MLTVKKKLKIFALCMGCFCSGALFAQPVGMVDLQKILLSVDEAKIVRMQLEDNYRGKQETLSKDEADLKKKQEDFEKQKAVLNGKARDDKERELKELYFSMQNKTMQFQRELQELEQKLKEPLIDKIRNVIVKVSKDKGLEQTFRMGPDSPLIYAKSEKDITEDVINAYNKSHPISDSEKKTLKSFEQKINNAKL